jgi:hypothetical protein
MVMGLKIWSLSNQGFEPVKVIGFWAKAFNKKKKKEKKKKKKRNFEYSPILLVTAIPY